MANEHKDEVGITQEQAEKAWVAMRKILSADYERYGDMEDWW